MRKLWNLVMSAIVVVSVAAGAQAGEAQPRGCLMDGSVCYSPKECCSLRCEVDDPNDTRGICVRDPGGPPGEAGGQH